MNRILKIFLLCTFITACQQQYYLTSNLNNISIGQSKSELLKMFRGEHQEGGAPSMQIRAAKQDGDSLIEIGEVLMTDRVSPTVAYWFLFENGSLIRWGQPADWKEIKVRYEINYNPSPSIEY